MVADSRIGAAANGGGNVRILPCALFAPYAFHVRWENALSTVCKLAGSGPFGRSPNGLLAARSPKP